MTSAERALKKLASAFPELDSETLEPLSRVIALLLSKREVILHSKSFLDQKAFDYMTAYILTHHALSSHPLKKENFEYAIEDTFRRCGKTVPISSDPTRRGVDVMIDNIGYSLKTYSSDGDAMPKVASISKFAESRWLREPLKTEDFEAILKLTKKAVETHLAEYDEILLFHNHAIKSGPEKKMHYRLYKVPKSIFQLTYSLNKDQLANMYLEKKDKRTIKSARVPQTVTAPLSLNGKVIANLSLDGSVEKLRFLSIDLQSCELQAEWKVDLLA
jgi:hypothetical protein